MHAVSCPICGQTSRVDAEAIGMMVACPHCHQGFVATAPPPRPARPVTAQPVPPPPRPALARRADDPLHSGHDDSPIHGLTPTLIGLALLPFGIPLLWAVAPLLTGIEPLFSYATPVALAIGLTGLGLGVGIAHGWQHTTRVKAMLALAMVGYFTGGFLYFMKKEWAEAVRRQVGPSRFDWADFHPPDRAYRIKFPGRNPNRVADGPLSGWSLTGFRLRHTNGNGRRNPDWVSIAFEVAHGKPPAEVVAPRLSDDEWFSVARTALQQACQGDLSDERAIAQQGHAGREYRFTLPDGATNRIVRIYRVDNRVFLLAVEGVFVAADAEYVRIFFDSFLLNPR